MPDPASASADPVSELRRTATIRARCGNILAAVERGESAHFTIERERLPDTARRVAEHTQRSYPHLRIPYHSRWRHFEAGRVDRKGLLDSKLHGRSLAEQARARIDLTVVSVLLDAGAGSTWRYLEPQGSQHFTRSEGLGVASFHALMSGAFSSDPSDPLRVDGRALQQMDADRLAALFQAGDANPLVGLEGRAELLRRLGDALLAMPDVFGAEGRPGGLYDSLSAHGQRTHVEAEELLGTLLLYLAPIWLTESRLAGVALGDVWPHPLAGGTGASAGWVPFHKLTQWLTYSLLEPFEWAGVQVTGLSQLTGLPEYRNGGLLMDTGVIVPRDAQQLHSRQWRVGDEPVVEWRALTVALIDELAVLVRGHLRLDEAHMPLARILEGGTWAAGRALAHELRGGLPPLDIASDGTVF